MEQNQDIISEKKMKRINYQQTCATKNTKGNSSELGEIIAHTISDIQEGIKSIRKGLEKYKDYFLFLMSLKYV